LVTALKDKGDALASGKPIGPAANSCSEAHFAGVDRPAAHGANDAFDQLTQVIRQEVANGYTVGHNEA
jgi:hypothetical protein